MVGLTNLRQTLNDRINSHHYCQLHLLDTTADAETELPRIAHTSEDTVRTIIYHSRVSIKIVWRIIPWWQCGRAHWGRGWGRDGEIPWPVELYHEMIIVKRGEIKTAI